MMNLRNCLFDDDFNEIGIKLFPKGIGRLICLRTLSYFPEGVDYLRNTPLLQELEIKGCPILKQRCERGRGDYWPNISHIPNIQIDFEYVQKDGQLQDDTEVTLLFLQNYPIKYINTYMDLCK